MQYFPSRRQRRSLPSVEPLERRQLLASALPVLTPAPSSGPAVYAPVAQPSVISTTPTNNSTNIHRDVAIIATLSLVSATRTIDAATLNTDNVELNRTSDGLFVHTTFSFDSSGNLVVTPSAFLSSNTQYTFKVTTGLKDNAGVSFTPFTMKFTTGTAVTNFDANIKFNQTDLANTHGQRYTCLAWGPDNKLYASTVYGAILRFTPNADGTLSGPEVFTTINKRNGGVNRAIMGMEFDPTSTADNLILWVTHGDGNLDDAADWSGKLSRLKGPTLSSYADFVVGLPRSNADHQTNQLHFGPDGALYIAQGAMNAMGAADTEWIHEEHLMSAAMLRVDIRHINAVVDCRTSEGGGTYNPYAAGALVTIYATGLRNCYDFVWASNGHLYAPTNGSDIGGSTPAGPNNNPPAMTNLPYDEPDWLFDVVKGGYYGHPDPLRGEYIANGGNPTSGVDPNEVPFYPVGTQPDPNYRGGLDLGANYAPTGIIQYKSNTFGGRLKGRLLMCRFSGGDDVELFTVNQDGSLSGTNAASGLDSFTGPIDIIEDPRNGNLYVAQYGDEDETGTVIINNTTPGCRITLLTPAYPAVSALRLINADSGISLGALKARQTINLAELPSRNLSIRAMTTAATASCKFTLDGVDVQTENYAPFAIAGNNLDGSYKPWTPTVGKHVLTITPYDTTGATGLAGDPVSLTFQVIDQPTAFSGDINFQPSTVPTSFKKTKSDIGRAFGLRGNGLTYGWSKDNSANFFDRNNPLSPDNRFDTGAIMGNNRWDIAVKNGTYSVFLLAGDPSDISGNYGINVEGVTAITGSPTAQHRWLGKTLTVTVTDNTLTLTTTPGSSGNKINLIQFRPA